MRSDLAPIENTFRQYVKGVQYNEGIQDHQKQINEANKKMDDIDVKQIEYTDDCRKKLEEKLQIAEYKLYKHIKEQIEKVAGDTRPTIGSIVTGDRGDPIKAIREELTNMIKFKADHKTVL